MERYMLLLCGKENLEISMDYYEGGKVMALIKCPECGREMSEQEKNCPECGFSFKEENIFEDLDKKVIEGTEEDTTVKQERLTQLENRIDKEDTVKKEKREFDKKKLCIGIALGISLIGNVILITNNNKSNSAYDTLQNEYNTIKEEQSALSSEYDNLSDDYNTLNGEYNALSLEVSEKEKTISALTAENEELKNGANKQLIDVRNAYEKGEWQNTIELANKLHEKYNGTKEDKEAQKMAKTSQEKLDEEAAAKAAEEAKGYETGITYDQLARTPVDFIGKKVKFSGKVLQVIEGDDSVQIRLAVNNDYDTVLLGEYSNSTVSSRVLEDDIITIYGTSVGTISYQSTMGGKITIPGVYIEKIDQ